MSRTANAMDFASPMQIHGRWSVPALLCAMVVGCQGSDKDPGDMHGGSAGATADEHSLTVDGTEVLTPAVAPEERTLIALFAIDENDDVTLNIPRWKGDSQGTSIVLFDN